MQTNNSAESIVVRVPKRQLSETDIAEIESRRKRKNYIQEGLKDGKSMEQLLENWTQCCFLMKKKNRLCNMGRASGSMYCGIHQPDCEVRSARIQHDSGKTAVKRIPCPKDPSHSIYEHNLKSHLKVCNVTAIRNNFEKEGIYCENCNSGPDLKVNVSEGSSDINPDMLLTKIRHCYLTHVYTSPLVDNLNEFGLHKDLDSCEQVYNQMAKEKEEVCHRVLEDLTGTQVATTRTRHADQDIAVLKYMMHHNLIDHQLNNMEEYVYAEYGAGRGYLGYAIHLYYQLYIKDQLSKSDSDSTCKLKDLISVRNDTDISLSVFPPKLLLVERSGVRRKAENRSAASLTIPFDGKSLTIANNSARYRLDIRHCYLPILSKSICEGGNNTSTNTKPKKIIIAAKHLCGVATDMSIRSLYTLKEYNQNLTTDPVAIPYGVSIATCCHHACNWTDYLGREWLDSLGFTAAEFSVMKSWSGWATLTPVLSHSRKGGDLGTKDAVDEMEHSPASTSNLRPSNISRVEMIRIGQQIKCIIDHGRAYYMKHVLQMKNVTYAPYCSNDLTPECRILFGRA